MKFLFSIKFVKRQHKKLFSFQVNIYYLDLEQKSAVLHLPPKQHTTPMLRN